MRGSSPFSNEPPGLKTSLTDAAVFTTILARKNADVAQPVEQLIRNQ